MLRTPTYSPITSPALIVTCRVEGPRFEVDGSGGRLSPGDRCLPRLGFCVKETGLGCTVLSLRITVDNRGQHCAERSFSERLCGASG